MRSSIYLGKMGDRYYDTWTLLRQTYVIVDRVIARKCQLFGITVPAYEVIYTVKYGAKPMSAYMLAHILGREHHSVVELVNRLKAKGLIKRVTVNGRPSLDVTDEGAELLERMQSSMPVIEDLFKSVGTTRIGELDSGLRALREAGLQQLGLVDMGEIRLPVGDGQRGGTAAKKAVAHPSR